MQIIKQAVDIAPDSGMVIDAVIDLVVQVQKDENSESAALREILVKGVGADTAHFIQGQWLSWKTISNEPKCT